jgi:hypothetical protein
MVGGHVGGSPLPGRGQRHVQTGQRQACIREEPGGEERGGLEGRGAAGAPQRAEQGFRCKKSAKSAISLYKVCI